MRSILDYTSASRQSFSRDQWRAALSFRLSGEFERGGRPSIGRVSASRRQNLAARCQPVVNIIFGLVKPIYETCWLVVSRAPKVVKQHASPSRVGAEFPDRQVQYGRRDWSERPGRPSRQR